MKLAVFDIGTNAFRLQAVDLSPGGVTVIDDFRRYTKLGKGFTNGEMTPEAIARARFAFDEADTFIHRHGIHERTGICTYIFRKAVNAAILTPYLEKNHIRVVDGIEEAAFARAGVAYDIDLDSSFVIDIGGGSTEFITLHPDTGAVKSLSTIGAVVLTEKFGIRNAAETEIARKYIIERLSTLPKDFKAREHLVAIGGTVTTLAMSYQQTSVYNAERIHRARIPRSFIEEKYAQLLTLNIAERIERLHIDPGRADVFHAGVLVLLTVMAYFSLDTVTVSHNGIRMGIALCYNARHLDQNAKTGKTRKNDARR